MGSLFERLSEKKRKDVRVLADFVRIFCREQHRDGTRAPFEIKDKRLREELANLELCVDCTRLLEHGVAKLSLCPCAPTNPNPPAENAPRIAMRPDTGKK